MSLNPSGILVQGTADSRTAIRAMIGNPAPALTLTGLPQGESMDLTPYHGKVVVVHFWRAFSIGRAPRPDEVHVRDVVAGFSADDVQVIGVHIDDDGARMRAFMEEHDVDWPSFVDNDGATVEAWHSNGRRNDLFIVDRQGNVLMGGIYQGDLIRALEIAVDDLGEDE